MTESAEIDALARSLYAHWKMPEARVIASRVLASEWAKTHIIPPATPTPDPTQRVGE